MAKGRDLFEAISKVRDIKAQLLKDIRRQVSSGNEVVGVRSLHDSEAALPENTTLPESYTWDDGDIDLSDPLGGTAAFKAVDPYSRKPLMGDAINRALIYRVGAKDHRLGILTGDDYLNHDMPEQGAALLENAILQKKYGPIPDALSGIYSEKQLNDLLKSKGRNLLANAVPIAAGLGILGTGLSSQDAMALPATDTQGSPIADVGSIQSVEHSYLDAAANAIDKYATTPIPLMEHPLSGTANLLRNLGRDRPLGQKYSDYLGPVQDFGGIAENIAAGAIQAGRNLFQQKGRDLLSNSEQQ